MNEKIRELAEESGITDNNLSDGNMSHNDLKKFAELIVRECIDTVQRRWVGDHNREDQEVLRCVADIKQHFGIEL